MSNYYEISIIIHLKIVLRPGGKKKKKTDTLLSQFFFIYLY